MLAFTTNPGKRFVDVREGQPPLPDAIPEMALNKRSQI
jgi:hypothetical protein